MSVKQSARRRAPSERQSGLLRERHQAPGIRMKASMGFAAERSETLTARRRKSQGAPGHAISHPTMAVMVGRSRTNGGTILAPLE